MGDITGTQMKIRMQVPKPASHSSHGIGGDRNDDNT